MRLSSNAQKSGKNFNLSFKYFELDDIVPIATKIFDEVGLISLVSFEETKAIMHILNTDNPEESVLFSAPFKPLEPIVSNAGKEVTNEMQALGSSITYMRRYLYMIALDICEPDSIDNGVTPDKPSTKPSTSLTDSNSNATELQIKQLKEVLKNLIEKW